MYLAFTRYANTGELKTVTRPPISRGNEVDKESISGTVERDPTLPGSQPTQWTLSMPVGRSRAVGPLVPLASCSSFWPARDVAYTDCIVCEHCTRLASTLLGKEVTPTERNPFSRVLSLRDGCTVVLLPWKPCGTLSLARSRHGPRMGCSSCCGSWLGVVGPSLGSLLVPNAFSSCEFTISLSRFPNPT